MWWAPYIGLSFGEGPGQVTCWSLVTRVYRERLGIDLPDYGEISARDLVRVARRMNERQAADPWRAVAEPSAHDVAIMRSGRGGAAIVHVGIMVDATRVLHVEAATSSVAVPVSHFSLRHRIAGYRRYQT